MKASDYLTIEQGIENAHGKPLNWPSWAKKVKPAKDSLFYFRTSTGDWNVGIISDRYRLIKYLKHAIWQGKVLESSTTRLEAMLKLAQDQPSNELFAKLEEDAAWHFINFRYWNFVEKYPVAKELPVFFAKPKQESIW